MLLKKTSWHIFSKLKQGRRVLAGINNTGRKTLYHRGSGVKRNARVIDFYRYICLIPAIVMTFEYDPNRTAPISLLAYANGTLAYNLSVWGTKPGSIVTTTVDDTIVKLVHNLGDTFSLNYLRPGLYINNLEIRPNTYSTCTRSSGTFAKLVSVAKDEYAVVKLKSKTLLRLKIDNIATVGAIMLSPRIKIKNAGANRRLGWRPHVRGVAMNPIDHPHGGGQGKTSGGRASVTPWALTTKGGRTRNKTTYAKTRMKR